MSDPFYFFSYFIAMCISVPHIADNRSYIGVKISDKCRYLLLIFSFKEIRISVIAIVAQIYLYIMLVLFILSKVAPPPRPPSLRTRQSPPLSRPGRALPRLWSALRSLLF